MSPSPDAPPSLWDFAVRTYAIPGVAPLCLRLQDEHDLDVDVLLGVLWLARRGVALDDAALASILDATARAHARVRELRALRRAVGSDRETDPRWQPTYDHLLAAELAAERVELACIEAAAAALEPAPSVGDPATLAGLGLRRYAGLRGATSCEARLRELVTLALPQDPQARD